VVQREIGDGRGLIDSRRSKALFGFMVTSDTSQTYL
jgi:hypothetical protein